MTDLAISEATRADIPAMAKVVADWEASLPWMKNSYDAQKIARFLYAAFDERQIFVTGDTANAYIAYDEATQRIGGLYSAVTGAGVGKALVDKVKEGRDFICLYTHIPNEAAQKFYRREGFVVVEQCEQETPDAIPELRMDWRK
jgi:GNAT superfamily N-acetyltransferase